MTTVMSAAETAAAIGIAAETLDRLRCYVELLTKWNQRINLVGPATLRDVWRRHILDSAQLFRLLPTGTETLVDLGSGAGLPGLILAIMGVPQVHLIESDGRKAAFLMEAARQTGAAAKVHIQRIETAPAIRANIVTARALAPLSQLLAYASRFLEPDSACLFLKGARSDEEIAAARRSWHMVLTEYPSLSDPAGMVLQVESIVREQQD